MNLPVMKSSRGVFDIFVPGLFLLINILAICMLMPSNTEKIPDLFEAVKNNQWSLLILMSILSYLFGVVLRMLRSEMADRMSAWYIRRLDRDVKRINREIAGLNEKLEAESDAQKRKEINCEIEKLHEKRSFAYDGFPYMKWIGYICRKRLTQDPGAFYEKIWKGKERRNYFNFAKTVVAIKDERAATEMYTAETLSRFTANMFYVIILSTVFLSVDLILNIINRTSFWVGILIAIVSYLFIINEILRSYRFMRIKEVETVFAATYINKEELKP